MSSWKSAKEFLAFAKRERRAFALAFLCVLINTLALVATPYFIAQAIDQAIQNGDRAQLFNISATLAVLFALAVATGYAQMRLMGHASQRVLFHLRQSLFAKIQQLPMAYLGGAKAGDLISRVNNDTDRINQFLSEGIIRFTNVVFSLIGIGVFMVILNPVLAGVTVAACAIIALGTHVLSPWVQKKSKESLEAMGDITAITQESLQNYKVIVAYHRQAYMQDVFSRSNAANRNAAAAAQIASGAFVPLYRFASITALLLVLAVGARMVNAGAMTAGVLIAFVAYTQRFYEPLMMLASFWGSLQGAVAAWGRTREVLKQ